MNVLVEVANGRTMKYKGKSRYVCFRLTQDGGFAVRNGSECEPIVKWAREKWQFNGNSYLVVDTISGESVGIFPSVPQNQIKINV